MNLRKRLVNFSREYYIRRYQSLTFPERSYLSTSTSKHVRRTSIISSQLLHLTLTTLSKRKIKIVAQKTTSNLSQLGHSVMYAFTEITGSEDLQEVESSCHHKNTSPPQLATPPLTLRSQLLLITGNYRECTESVSHRWSFCSGAIGSQEPGQRHRLR